MFYLLDTNTCIYAIANKRGVYEKIVEAGFGNCFISEATLAELYYGVYKSLSFVQNHQAVITFVAKISVIETGYLAETFGETKALLATKGLLISDFDILIGSAGLFYDITVITNNTRHFSRIPNLRLDDWLNP